jgi:hypothetical protein
LIEIVIVIVVLMLGTWMRSFTDRAADLGLKGKEITQCVSKAWRSQLIAKPSPVGCGRYQSAAAQTCKMVRQIGSARFDNDGQIRWKGWTLKEGNKNRLPNWICKGKTHALQR